MNLKVTFTCILSDEHWGFSDLLNGRELNEETKSEIEELLWEDITSVIEDAPIQIEEYTSFLPK